MSKQREIDPLNADEKKVLRKCESVIKRGVKTFVEVGNALKTIQEQQLYRADHMTFDEYCKNRWDMSRAHAYRLIESAKVVEDVSPIGDSPRTESQARPLTKIKDKTVRQEVWQEVTEQAGDGPVTAKAVEQAVAKRQEIPNVAINPGQPDPNKLCVRCPHDGIACWVWRPFSIEDGRLVFHEDTLNAPVYTHPPKNASEAMETTVVVSPAIDLFQKADDGPLEAVLEAAEKAKHWTFLFVSRNYSRLFSYPMPPHIWTGAIVTTQEDLVRAEAEAIRGRSENLFVCCSPLLEPLVIAPDHPFKWFLLGGSDPQPSWEAVWSVTAQTETPVTWAESLEARPDSRPYT